MSSLIDSVSTGSPEVVRSLSARLGEPNDFIQKGLQISAASMLGSIAGRSNEPSFLSEITNTISAYGRNRLDAKASMEAGSAFLVTLFGADRPAVEKKIAQAAGLGNPSAGPVLLSAAPLLLSQLAQKIASRTLSQIVTAELPRLAILVPAGIPGQTRLASLAANAHHARPNAESKPGKHWLWPILVLGAVLIIALIWYANRPGAVLPTPVAHIG